VDPLRRDDVEVMRRTPPEEKARQVLDLFETALLLKRAALRARRPDASDAELEAAIRAWLARDD